MRNIPTIIFLLSSPALLLAHPGHSHHVMGTVSAVAANRLEIKDMTGATVSIELVPETQCLRDKELIATPTFRVGDRIMVEAKEVSGKMVAVKVRLGKTEAKAAPM